VDLQTQSRQMRVAVALIAAKFFLFSKFASDMSKPRIFICDSL
jgi:hypothetical protein